MPLLQTEKFEVEPEEYFSKFLKKDDARHLRPFVANLGGRLSVPCAILAVGSSVFPEEYWRDRVTRGIDKARGFYRDIDLLVVPDRVIVPLNKLEKSVQGVLTSLGFKWEIHESTACGDSYHKQRNGGYISFFNVDYGLHSISANLKNGTKIDLILGRDDLLEKTAMVKIEEERREGRPFSLLYKR